MNTTKYYATTEGFIQGTYRKVGDEIEMTEAQAKYLLLEGQVSATAPVAAQPQAKAPSGKSSSDGNAKAGE